MPRCLIAALLIALGCHQALAQAPSRVLAAYALLVPGKTGGTVAHARVVVEGVTASCPILGDQAGGIATTPRANPDDARFPVTLCEAQIPFGQSLAVGSSGLRIPAVTSAPRHLLIYGDTGCKASHCPAGQAATPFATLAGEGAKLNPELLLHMGDFNYRGTPGFLEQGMAVYDAGDTAPSDPQCQLEAQYYSQNAEDSSQKDDWDKWLSDFFTPAAPLSARAPWVFARGNHELCSRAGPGWFYFLDPGSDLPGSAQAQFSCPAQGSLADPDRDVMSHLRFGEPYRLELDTLSLLVLDSANACDGFAPAATTKIYARQLARLGGSGKSGKGGRPVWIMTHRPIWGLSGHEQINRMLQAAVAETGLPAGVGLALGGHMHLFESITLDGAAPPQLILGNGGVSLDPRDRPASFETEFGSRKGAGRRASKFGFLDLQLDANGGWSASLTGPGSTTIAQCGSERLPGSVCELSP
jgi:hypothetical protein